MANLKHNYLKYVYIHAKSTPFVNRLYWKGRVSPGTYTDLVAGEESPICVFGRSYYKKGPEITSIPYKLKNMIRVK